MLEPQLCLLWPSNRHRTIQSYINIIKNYLLNRFNQKSLIINLIDNMIMLNSPSKKEKHNKAPLAFLSLFSFFLSIARSRACVYVNNPLLRKVVP